MDFKKFLLIMKNPLQTFITDQNKAQLVKASIVFNKTKNNICKWHFEKNIQKNISYLIKFKDTKDNPQSVIKLIYSENFEKDFEAIVNKFKDNKFDKAKKYITYIYENKNLWARQYTEKTFTCGIHVNILRYILI